MKRLLASIVILYIILLNTLTVGAIDNMIDTNVKIYDYAELIDDSKETSLSVLANDFKEKYSLDIAVVTIIDNEGKNAKDYADDFYDYNNFGCGNDKDGLLLLIDMDSREIRISTSGIAIKIFKDRVLDDMLDVIYDCVIDKRYNSAAEMFINDAKRYTEQSLSEGYIKRNENGTLYKPFRLNLSFKHIAVFMIFAMVGGGITVAVMVRRNNTIRPSSKADLYAKNNSFELLEQQDIYKFSNVTKTQKVKLESSGSSSGKSSGGGSSVHRSSSGRSHGGGGRKF